MPARASLVIPVRPALSAKVRLAVDTSAEAQERRVALAAAIALDTVEAARRSPSVGELFVVGSLAEPVDGVQVVTDPGFGLLVAISEGLARCNAAAPTAVLLGDLPALQPADLDAALLGASEHHWAFVPDVEGAGTTLVVAQEGLPHSLRFGDDSAEQHGRSGYAELEVAQTSGLRRDVDTLAQLDDLARLDELGIVRLGPRTRALL
jgi:2-phospho-L-lactate guanylyltransferase